MDGINGILGEDIVKVLKEGDPSKWRKFMDEIINKCYYDIDFAIFYISYGKDNLDQRIRFNIIFEKHYPKLKR